MFAASTPIVQSAVEFMIPRGKLGILVREQRMTQTKGVHSLPQHLRDKLDERYRGRTLLVERLKEQE
jgi:hypothetical protein